ncbi:MAG: HPr family phosphocarrier protein [Agathobacter sp.]|nr:HPr family phosphocarrier protein [Agathobacter sp.]
MHEKEKVVIFDEMQDIRDFVNAAEACDFDIDVYGNRVVVDAKSILGMLGFGLKKSLRVRYNGWNENFENIIAKFATA